MLGETYYTYGLPVSGQELEAMPSSAVGHCVAKAARQLPTVRRSPRLSFLKQYGVPDFQGQKPSTETFSVAKYYPLQAREGSGPEYYARLHTLISGGQGEGIPGGPASSEAWAPKSFSSSRGHRAQARSIFHNSHT